MVSKNDIFDRLIAMRMEDEVMKEMYRPMGFTVDPKSQIPAVGIFHCETVTEAENARAVLVALPGVLVSGDGTQVIAGPVGRRPSIDRAALHHHWPIQWKEIIKKE